MWTKYIFNDKDIEYEIKKTFIFLKDIFSDSSLKFLILVAQFGLLNIKWRINIHSFAAGRIVLTWLMGKKL